MSAFWVGAGLRAMSKMGPWWRQSGTQLPVGQHDTGLELVKRLFQGEAWGPSWEIWGPSGFPLLSTLSSRMKGSPVPSCGPTPPPQVPVASRPQSSTTSLDKGTEALQAGTDGGELGGSLSLLTHCLGGTSLHTPPSSLPDLPSSPPGAGVFRFW